MQSEGNINGWEMVKEPGERRGPPQVGGGELLRLSAGHAEMSGAQGLPEASLRSMAGASALQRESPGGSEGPFLWYVFRLLTVEPISTLSACCTFYSRRPGLHLVRLISFFNNTHWYIFRCHY